MDCPLIKPMLKEDSFSPYDERTLPPATYRGMNNTLYLGNRLSEHNVDVFIVHELSHWATFQSLSASEQQDIFEHRSNPKRIFERIAYLTETCYIVDELTGYCSVDEAYRLAALPELERKQLLGANSRQWWLIELLQNSTTQYDKLSKLQTNETYDCHV